MTSDRAYWEQRFKARQGQAGGTTPTPTAAPDTSSRAYWEARYAKKVSAPTAAQPEAPIGPVADIAGSLIASGLGAAPGIVTLNPALAVAGGTVGSLAWEKYRKSQEEAAGYTPPLGLTGEAAKGVGLSDDAARATDSAADYLLAAIPGGAGATKLGAKAVAGHLAASAQKTRADEVAEALRTGFPALQPTAKKVLRKADEVMSTPAKTLDEVYGGVKASKIRNIVAEATDDKGVMSPGKAFEAYQKSGLDVTAKADKTPVDAEFRKLMGQARRYVGTDVTIEEVVRDTIIPKAVEQAQKVLNNPLVGAGSKLATAASAASGNPVAQVAVLYKALGGKAWTNSAITKAKGNEMVTKAYTNVLKWGMEPHKLDKMSEQLAVAHAIRTIATHTAALALEDGDEETFRNIFEAQRAKE